MNDYADLITDEKIIDVDKNQNHGDGENGFTAANMEDYYDYNNLEIDPQVNNHTLASVTHILQYNLENPYDPGFTIHIVKNKPKLNTTKKSYIRNSMIRKMEKKRLQDQVSSFWNWQEKYFKKFQDCDLDTVG